MLVLHSRNRSETHRDGLTPNSFVVLMEVCALVRGRFPKLKIPMVVNTRVRTRPATDAWVGSRLVTSDTTQTQTPRQKCVYPWLRYTASSLMAA